MGEQIAITLDVEFGRHQRIAIRETADTFELTGIVARAATIDTIPDVPLRAWRRNRAMQLVGFRLDQKNKLVGEAWVPKAGLDRDEFFHYVKHLASECDLFEYHLTGRTENRPISSLTASIDASEMIDRSDSELGRRTSRIRQACS